MSCWQSSSLSSVRCLITLLRWWWDFAEKAVSPPYTQTPPAKQPSSDNTKSSLRLLSPRATLSIQMERAKPLMNQAIAHIFCQLWSRIKDHTSVTVLAVDQVTIPRAFVSISHATQFLVKNHYRRFLDGVFYTQSVAKVPSGWNTQVIISKIKKSLIRHKTFEFYFHQVTGTRNMPWCWFIHNTRHHYTYRNTHS